MDAIVTHYLHYLGFALLLACVTMELVLFRPTMDAAAVRTIARVDGLYGLSALVVLATGLLKWFQYGKPAAYYGQNFIFHIKVTLFVVVFLLSLAPTVRFFKARRAAAGGTVSFPSTTRILLRLQLAILLVIPLLAVMMSQGYGYTG